MYLMNSQLDYFNSKLDSVLNEMNTVKAENSEITLENIKLYSKIDALKIKLDELEKNNLRHSIEIKGIIPMWLNENCLDIIKTIAKTVKSNIMVNLAYRISVIENISLMLVAEISSVEMKKDFIHKIKKKILIQSWLPITGLQTLKYFWSRD